MNDGFEPLESGEVISVQHDTQVLGGHNTFKVGELNNAIKGYLEKEISDWNEEKSAWFSRQGIDCEAFRFSSAGWQKGRIRLSLEFCPEDEFNSTARNANAASSNVTTTTINPTNQAPAQSAHSPIHLESSTVAVDAHHDSTQVQAVTLPTNVPTAATNITDAVIPIAGVAATGSIAATILTTNGSNNGSNGSVANVLPSKTAETADFDRTTSSTAEIALEPIDSHRDTREIETKTANSDVVLEPKDLYPNYDDRDTDLFDNMAFDFDRANHRERRSIESNSGMELELTDLGLDISEQDFLNFETNWMPDPTQDYTNPSPHDDRMENSGMLIDEVWHEIENQPNWPGIN
jgi:hypothetical protein